MPIQKRRCYADSNHWTKSVSQSCVDLSLLLSKCPTLHFWHFSGLIKGMLVVKSGIDRIIIPKSMVKAKSSQVSTDDFAYVIFKSMSSPSKPCKAFGKYLDPEEVAADSFVKQSPTKLSDMYVRMLVGLGLSPQQCNGYVKDSLKLPGLRHCSFMGVADPTGSIPYGMIFIPGCELYSM